MPKKSGGGVGVCLRGGGKAGERGVRGSEAFQGRSGSEPDEAGGVAVGGRRGVAQGEVVFVAAMVGLEVWGGVPS